MTVAQWNVAIIALGGVSVATLVIKRKALALLALIICVVTVTASLYRLNVANEVFTLSLLYSDSSADDANKNFKQSLWTGKTSCSVKLERSTYKNIPNDSSLNVLSKLDGTKDLSEGLEEAVNIDFNFRGMSITQYFNYCITGDINLLMEANVSVCTTTDKKPSSLGIKA